ncbi:MAG: invasin domain 3-containing protein, partial [Candidatus Micrarchaeota archaeon]
MTQSNSLRLFVATFLLSALCLTLVGAAFAGAAFLPAKNLGAQKTLQIKRTIAAAPQAISTPTPTPAPKAGPFPGADPGDVYRPPIDMTPKAIDDTIPLIEVPGIDEPCFPVGPVEYLVIHLPEGMTHSIPAGRTSFGLGVYAYNGANCSLGLRNADWTLTGTGSGEINEYLQGGNKLTGELEVGENLTIPTSNYAVKLISVSPASGGLRDAQFQVFRSSGALVGTYRLAERESTDVGNLNLEIKVNSISDDSSPVVNVTLHYGGAAQASFKALHAGSLTLQASIQDENRTISTSVPLTVRPSDAYKIDLTVDPAIGAVFAGEEFTLNATVYDRYNNTVDGARVYFNTTYFVFTETGTNETNASTVNGSVVLHMNSNTPGASVVTAWLDRPTRGTSCHFSGGLPSGRIVCVSDEIRSPRIRLPANFSDDYNPVYSDEVTVWFLAGQPATLLLTAEPASIEADGVSNSTITATVRDALGNPTAAIINFSTTAGTLSDDSVTAYLFGDGTVEVNLTASLEVVDAVVAAVAYWPIENVTPVTAQITVPFTAGPPASLEMTLSTNDTYQGDPVDVHIVVEDARGHVVTDGTTVDFCATPEVGAVQCTTYTTTNGTVDFVFTWPDPVRVDVNATAGTVSDSDSIVFRVLPPAYLLLDAVSPMTIGQQSLVTATLLNRNYLPVPDGEIISFNVLDGVGLLSAPAATTVGGIAQVNVTSDESGYVTVGASWNSTLFNTTDVLFVGEPANIVLTADDYTPEAGQSITLTANVTDENGYPAAEGTIVDFVAPADVIFTGSSMPTVDGIAQTNASSTVAGTYVITALVGSLQANVTITVSPAAPDQVIITPTDITLRAGEGQQFNAVVYDAFGNVVSASVSWSTGALGSINASGYFTAVRAGNESVSATAGTVSNSTNVTIRPGVLASLEVTAVPASIQVGGATSTISITGRDANGDLVDEAVNVSLDASLGTLSDSSVLLASGTA